MKILYNEYLMHLSDEKYFLALKIICFVNKFSPLRRELCNWINEETVRESIHQDEFHILRLK